MRFKTVPPPKPDIQVTFSYEEAVELSDYYGTSRVPEVIRPLLIGLRSCL